jgi:N-acetylmuramoyl-L-alanine amidase
MRKIGYLTLLICILLTMNGASPAHAKANDSYIAKVFADSLNVRSEPSSAASIQGAFKNGDLVTVSDERHGWLKVKGGRISGWAAGYYLKKTDSSLITVSVQAAQTGAKSIPATKASALTQTGALSTGKQTTVLADGLRVRGGPGVKYNVTGSVDKGERLAVLDSRDGWLLIRMTDGQTGWVSAQYMGDESKARGSVQTSAASLKGKVIVVDPGHGGSDPGMVGTTYETEEKVINLSTAFYLRDELRARGAKVVMTRTKDDQKPALSERVNVSESNGADAFVSIHYNSSPKKASGTLTFFYSELKDSRLTRAIEGRLAAGIGLKSKGISFGDFHVLRENDAPSTLVELGYLTNEKDEKLVQTAGYQRKAAAAIASGLEDYFRQNNAS